MKKTWIQFFAMLLTFALWSMPALANNAVKVYEFDGFSYILLEDGSAEITGHSGGTSRLVIPALLDGHAVVSIGVTAFNMHEGLTEVTLPEGLLYIKPAAFINCFNITGFNIPDSVTSIEDDAFGCCESLASVTIGSGLEYMGSNPFSACVSLSEIKISPDNANFTLAGGALIYKPENRFICYPAGLSGTSYQIPDGTLTIGDYAFFSCRRLESIIIPESVTSIGDDTFAYCSNLTGMKIPDGVISIGNGVFAGCNNLASLSLPESISSIGSEAFSGCEMLTLTVAHGSYAEAYADANGIRYIYADGK